MSERQPLILVGRDGGRRVVLAADAATQAAGLRVGMPATKARLQKQGGLDPSPVVAGGLVPQNQTDPEGSKRARHRRANV